jgi:hypothetical protein
VACLRADDGGYAVAVTEIYVNVKSHSGRTVFYRFQPDKSRRHTAVSTLTRIVHRETHRGITCDWTTALGGSSRCTRSDGRGYTGWVSPHRVTVWNERGKRVFLRRQ